MREFSASILWKSEKNQNGIMVCGIGNDTQEIYFDASAFPEFKEAKRHDIVEFNLNTNIKNCLCGKDLKILK